MRKGGREGYREGKRAGWREKEKKDSFRRVVTLQRLPASEMKILHCLLEAAHFRDKP